MAFDIVPYGAAIEATSNLLSGILKRVFPEKVSEETALKLNQEITMALINGELQPVLAQLKINEEEAKSEKLFISGWRPGMGWTCVAAFAWTFVAAPMSAWWLEVFGVKAPPLPVLDYMTLSPILMGLLGLGGLRTYEKVKGASDVKVGN